MESLGAKFPVQTLAADENGSYDTPENVAALENASAVIVSAGFDKTTEKENSDRTFSLPRGQDEIIEFALEHNSKVAVVVYAGGAFDMSRWGGRVSAIVAGWYPGQEGGLALARMLTGEFSPSGRLPMSFEASLEDNPSSSSYYPAEAITKRGLTNRYVVYSEGVFMGYRGYDKSGTEPLYPFGHGLSYTSFEYSGLDVAETDEGLEVAFTVTNTGKFDAAEVAQVYVGALSSPVPRPLKELKGFEKIFLRKGEGRRITVRIPKEDYARYYSNDAHDWVEESGSSRYRIMVGASAGDIRLETVK